ncbi:MAG: FAD-dependent oxidoreductase [Psychromonas sp.]
MQAHLEALKDSKYCSVWHDQAIKPDTSTALKGDKICELVIVGGGFTGLWAALQAKERQPDADIILIEKTFIGDGASGRNGGFLSAHLAHGDGNTELQFPDEAEQLHALGQQNLKEFIETLTRYNIDAHYEKVGDTVVATAPSSVDDLREIYEKEKAAGEDVVWFNKEEMQAQVNSPTYLAGLWFRGGYDGIIDPARLCWGLKRVIEELGVRIYEQTALQRFVSLDSQKMKVYCDGGSITSDKIFMATNAYRSSLAQIRKTIIPIWDYQLATEPLTPEQMALIGWDKFHHALSNHVNMFHYYRLTKDNRITWGGGGAVRYYYNNGTDQNCADIPARFEQLSKEFFETFPQLEGLKFSHRWSGIIATSSRFCVAPGVAYDGRVAWAVGYTGLGVGASRFGARVGIELLGYQPSDILKMQFVNKKVIAWAPEPLRWIGVRLTQRALEKADANGGKRGAWLKMLDMMNLGFTC